MSNKRITDLTELTTPTTDDVFPVVDIATNTTTKVQLANLPVQTAVTTALATKQDTLVSGTNIKTLNSVSLLGTGNIVLAATPSGVSGAIQFSNGSAFASDAANLFWDDTNNRLGVGTNTPSVSIQSTSTIQGVNLVATANANFGNILYGPNFWSQANGDTYIGFQGAPSAKLQIKGNGSTSATTSLLVQNSSGTQVIKSTDNGTTQFGAFDASASVTQPLAVTASGANNAGIAIYASGSGNAGMDYYRNGAFKFNVGIGGGSDNFAWFNGAFGNYSFYILYDATGRTIFGGTTGSASAQVSIDSTTRGFLPPRMTTTQRDAIVTPATGLRIYNTTTNTNDTYNGTAWQSNSVNGVAGAIQFSNGSAFASDAANLFWDDTNNRLGIGTNAPTQILDLVRPAGQLGAIRFFNASNSENTIQSGSTFRIFNSTGGTPAASVGFFQNVNNQIGINTNNPTASLNVQGSGSTSATTSLLVQNSAGTNLFKVSNDGVVSLNTLASLDGTGVVRFPQYLRTTGGNFTFKGSGGSDALYLSESVAQFVAPISFGTGSPSASACVDLTSTTKGFLPPRMTTTQKNAIASPATGLVLYDSTTNKLQCYNGSTWNDLF